MSASGSGYTRAFYDRIAEGALRSAGRIVPMLLEVLRPGSVVDVGCGLGTWLSVFREHGVPTCIGIDGGHVERADLCIPAGDFLAADLSEPLTLERDFDLVVSLEVAEHLPPQSAQTFVDSLVRLGPVVLFSAAIPGQGGKQHRNEQWPRYWQRRFARHDYVALDALRMRLWQEPEVEFWYAQNIALYVSREHLAALPSAWRESSVHAGEMESLVHPEHYTNLLAERQRDRELIWQCLQELLALDLERLTPREATILLVDGESIPRPALARRTSPFPQRDGEFAGVPADDAEAIGELERRRGEGAAFIAVPWPARWWLDSFPRFARHLRERYPCVQDNARAVVFELRSPGPARTRRAGAGSRSP